MPYERLKYVQVREHEVEVSHDVYEVDYGDGYGDAALVGSPSGLRTWRVVYGHLHRHPHRREGQFAAQSTEAYIWDFYNARRAEGRGLFIFRCTRTKKDFLGKFKNKSLSYRALLDAFYTSSLEIEQAREPGVEFDPVDGSLALAAAE